MERQSYNRSPVVLNDKYLYFLDISHTFQHSIDVLFIGENCVRRNAIALAIYCICGSIFIYISVRKWFCHMVANWFL